ncbi:hypothetical protein [Mucilaginibacter psychrotolerans]|uniref:Uncharacterized protein n=1 Tax=Mucilaginibacter psychrotolerans TaxID=1524096 RepID=A0A4Y8SRT7_9SPHI|nr:hypothetical protein [Mucilaginibacter psychrotolerans]TFF40976.1 hypothetical protein E2R66_02020 [Mucilaginibacter psychrotolerans]
MKKILIPAICLLLAACDSGSGDKPQINLADTTVVPGKPLPELVSADLVKIDSSAYVMYPLLHNRDQNDEDSGSFVSSDGGRSRMFWNIIFYNTATKKYHLLDDKRKMIINAYNIADSNSEYYGDVSVPDQFNPNTIQEGNFIFYSIITEDYNKDRKLDSDDPTYLFMSDKEGNNLRQISPSGTNVVSWDLIKKSAVILMQTQRDSTRNGEKFEAPRVPYIYDLKKGGIPERVFDAKLNGELNALHQKQWPVKKK